MREIKFRAWVPKGYTRWGKEGGMVMLSWKELIDDLHSEANPNKSVLGLGISHKEEGVVFMQNTGLKEKNGKEIYEGDILAYSNKRHRHYEVVWNESRAQFDMKRTVKNYTLQYRISKAPSQGKNLEIIGNIYETPKLLEDNNKDHDY